MRHQGTAARLRPCVLAICVLACAWPLLSPLSAMAYGGGGGDAGSAGFSGMGASVNVEPLTGIEGMPVMPSDGPGFGVGAPGTAGTGSTGPATTSKAEQMLNDFIADQAKGKAIDLVTALHPGLGMAVNVADKLHGAYDFGKKAVDKVVQAKKDYQKAALGTLGSGLQAPEVNPVDMGPSRGIGGGGGPQRLHQQGLW